MWPGNGTQSLAWQINEDAFRETLEIEASGIMKKVPLQIYYGSLHDPLSYPCEVQSFLNLAIYRAYVIFFNRMATLQWFKLPQYLFTVPTDNTLKIFICSHTNPRKTSGIVYMLGRMPLFSAKPRHSSRKAVAMH